MMPPGSARRLSSLIGHAVRDRPITCAMSVVGGVLVVAVLITSIQAAFPINQPRRSWSDGTGGSHGAAPSSEAPSARLPSQPEIGPSSHTEIVVHVVGKVRNAGVHRLAAGSRIVDVVERAGGATDEADLTQINLAREAIDGEQVVIPGRDAPNPSAGTHVAERPPGPTTAPHGRVNLNRSDVQTLARLPRIGTALAERIVAFREKHGPFRSVGDLRRVTGIGDKTIAEITPYVVAP